MEHSTEICQRQAQQQPRFSIRFFRGTRILYVAINSIARSELRPKGTKQVRIPAYIFRARCLAKFEYIRNVISKYPCASEDLAGRDRREPHWERSTRRVSIYSPVYSICEYWNTRGRKRRSGSVVVRDLGVFSRASPRSNVEAHTWASRKLRK